MTPKRIALAALLAVLLYWFVWPTPYLWVRYRSAQGEELTLRINRFTGVQLMPAGDGWHPATPP